MNEDIFQKEVAHKTQTYMVGRQEAETEVVLDRLIQREGNKDKALLYVVSEMHSEVKVQSFVNTLLHRGANPSFCDKEWRTPLHHAVRRGFKGVVSKLLEHDALPHVRDKKKTLPFRLALEENFDEIGAMLLQSMPNHVVRDLFITHDNNEAECTFHSLLDRNMQESALAVLDCMIDKIGQTGHVRVYYHILEADEKGRPPTHPDFQKNSRSCLHLMSKEGNKDVIFHFVVRLLIRRKWKEFARLRFQLNSFLFLLTLMSLTFSVVVSVVTPDPTVYDTPLHVARAVFEVWAVMTVVVTFIVELNQFRKHKLEYWRDQFNWIDISSSGLLITVVPLRFCHAQEQWPVFAMGYLLWTLRIFKYAAVFRQTGAYAQILWRIISHDFLQFTVVFLVILLAFSGSFVLALRGEDSLSVHNETSDFWQVLFTGVRILIEGQPVVEYSGEYGYKVMSCILMVVFLFFCCVVLLNILIAQLSDTYQNVQRDAQRGLELNRAWIITRVELNSLFIGKSYRVSKYTEAEELSNPLNVLEKCESPLLNEMSQNVREVQESLVSTHLNMQTITNRLSRQEYALKRIQEQLNEVLQCQKSSIEKKQAK
ncbi:vanilloid receptor [Aplysia californica]|uniref:Vanilloid receptor n=1 Tax=Aplysia californica TaxID=6500 RepID=E2QDA5_APLCA|nr:vanilloid receptor [Aplysia californica]AAQ17228.1 vanilloid receptor [Aplysia californica]